MPLVAASLICPCATMEAYFPGNETLFISGSVLTEGEGGQPTFLPGIRIIASSFAQNDKIAPICQDTVYTTSQGTYSLTIDKFGCRNFKIEAADIDAQGNGGLFEGAVIDMEVEPECEKMMDQNFYLRRL